MYLKLGGSGLSVADWGRTDGEDMSSTFLSAYFCSSSFVMHTAKKDDEGHDVIV